MDDPIIRQHHPDVNQTQNPFFISSKCFLLETLCQCGYNTSVINLFKSSLCNQYNFEGVTNVEFLPQPQRITHGEGRYSVRYYTNIVLVDTQPSAFLYAQMLKKDFEKYAGLQLNILRGHPRRTDIALRMDKSLREDFYCLTISPEKAEIAAGSDEALLHGVQTLGQWVQHHGGALPSITIEDWPDLPNRGYYQDCSRGSVPTLENLKHFADLLCRYKINEWQLYVEHTYLFRDFSEAWRDETPLTAEDILSLDAYCRERHIDLVPSLASFGNMHKLLSTKNASRQCERHDDMYRPCSSTEERKPLDVSTPSAMAFVKSLIAELMPLFTSKKFNICCDATFDSSDAPDMYITFVSELCSWLIEQGKTPQFWGDLIRRRPEAYSRIPKGAVCLNWGLSCKQSDNVIGQFASMGAVQYVCPGIATWNQWTPQLRASYENILLMSRYAHHHGCIGLLNVDKGEMGYLSNPWFSVSGILYGAAFSWNRQEFSFEEINSAISFLHYGQKEGTIISTFAEMGSLGVFSWKQAIRYIEETDPEKRCAIFQEVVPYLNRVDGHNHQIDEIIDRMLSQSVQIDPEKRNVIQVVCVHANAIRLFNEIGVYLAVHFDALGDVEYRNGDTLAADLECWFRQYKMLWAQSSRQNTLHSLQNAINAYADLLRARR